MNSLDKALIALAILILTHAGAVIYGMSAQKKTDDLSNSEKAVTAWSDRFVLQSQLATRDIQLAQEQARAEQSREKTVIKYEVVYREKIKDHGTRDCVAASGLLKLYDASLGVPDPTGGSDDKITGSSPNE